MADPKMQPCLRFLGPAIKEYLVDIDNDGRLDRLTVAPPLSAITEEVNCDLVNNKAQCDASFVPGSPRYEEELARLCKGTHGIITRPASYGRLPLMIDGEHHTFAEGARTFLGATFRNINGESFKWHDRVRLVSDDGMDIDDNYKHQPTRFPQWNSQHPWTINSFDLKGFSSDPNRKDLSDMTRYPDSTHKYAVIYAHIMSTDVVHYEKRDYSNSMFMSMCICCSPIIAYHRYKEVPIELLSEKNIPSEPPKTACPEEESSSSCGGGRRIGTTPDSLARTVFGGGAASDPEKASQITALPNISAAIPTLGNPSPNLGWQPSSSLMNPLTLQMKY
ncbi:MAG: hypothetical protein WC956_11035 [bacterium]